MLFRVRYLQVLAFILIAVLPGANTVLGQTSIADLQKILQQRIAFNETDFAALHRGETIVKLAPRRDKREVAVSGMVSLHASAPEFLRSYRESVTGKNNAAILETGRFSNVPALADLQNLTLEPRDIEDLKECVVGDCNVKLSAAMIERFRNEIDWQAPDYALKATQLFRSLLLDYVTDYRKRGDAALIQYNDKRDEVRLADEHRSLMNAPGYLNQFLKAAQPDGQLIEDMIVWSKIEFGLKPVIAINHIRIYQRDSGLGLQVLASSKQIYANHYFNSSLALTAFVTVAGPASYLVYENRSRADGLGGPFGRIKRSIVENRAVDGLKAILDHSKRTFAAPLSTQESAIASANSLANWGRRLFGGIRPLLWVLFVSAIIALLVLRKYEGNARARAITFNQGDS